MVADRKQDLVRARALYDHVIDRMRDIKYGDGWIRRATKDRNSSASMWPTFFRHMTALSRLLLLPDRLPLAP